MQLRKLQITGGVTFVVSLPREWVLGQGLKAGDSVGLLPQDEGNLLLLPHPSAGTSARSHALEVSEIVNPDHLFRNLLACYLQGFDSLQITSKKRIEAELRGRLREMVKRFMGTEIIEESSRDLVIQDITDPATLPMKRALRRMALMASAMVKDAIQGVTEGDPGLAKDVIGRDDEVDRLYWFVLKQYNKYLRTPTLMDKAGMTREEALVYLLAGRLVERVADHACRISYQTPLLHGHEISSASRRATGVLSALATKSLEDALQALFERNIPVANRIIDGIPGLRQTKEALLHAAIREKAEIAIPLAYVAESLERIGLYGTDICEVSLNLSCTVSP